MKVTENLLLEYYSGLTEDGFILSKFSSFYDNCYIKWTYSKSKVYCESGLNLTRSKSKSIFYKKDGSKFPLMIEKDKFLSDDAKTRYREYLETKNRGC